MTRHADAMIERALAGEEIYGDRFSPAEIVDWFRGEEHAYAEFKPAGYEWHGLNWLHGFRFLENRHFRSILSVGGATGEELIPVIERTQQCTVLDPGNFAVPYIRGRAIRYVTPHATDPWPFENNSFDLITCFGTLHHIPNVTARIHDLARCLMPEGCALIREPVVAMGDWRFPRRGLTPRERGIPLECFRRAIHASGLVIERERMCMFSPLGHVPGTLNSRMWMRVDELLCRLLPYRYHARHWWEKLRPGCVFYMLRKP